MIFAPGAAHAAKPAADVAVCNEAENSWQGDYDLATTDDPADDLVELTPAGDHPWGRR